MTLKARRETRGRKTRQQNEFRRFTTNETVNVTKNRVSKNSKPGTRLCMRQSIFSLYLSRCRRSFSKPETLARTPVEWQKSKLRDTQDIPINRSFTIPLSLLFADYTASYTNSQCSISMVRNYDRVYTKRLEDLTSRLCME